MRIKGKIEMPDARGLPEVAYHYTSMDVLLKIVETNNIWATNIKYLNDVLEREHCMARVRARLGSAEGKELFGAIEEDFGDLEERNSTYRLPYVASFSADRDDLAQWRSYCPHGNGVCIGFRTESLSNTFPVSFSVQRPERKDDIWIDFGAVKYLHSNDVDTIDEAIRRALDKAMQWEAVNPDWIKAGVKKDLIFWSEIEGFAARTKHISFTSEKEFRLVVGDSSSFFGYVRFRASRSTLIPYVALGLPDPKEFLAGVGHMTPLISVPYVPQPYFIDNVTIGPTPHSELSKDSLEILFGDINRDVVIHLSEVPYRDW